MIHDHYAMLEVPPTANAAVIRAAFLALMREYHPDRNPDPAAVERAKAVIAAFKVLGDFDQRNHYDWDRRRAREAADAAAAKRPRRIRAGATGAAAVGLAAVGAWVFTPASVPSPSPVRAPVADVRQVPVAKAKPTPEARQVAVFPQVKEEAAKREAVAKIVPVAEAVRVARIEPMPPRPPKAKQAPVVQVAAARSPAPKVTPRPASPPPPVHAPAPPKSVQVIAKPTTDLASLDQFVMNFYGQSWRYGDAPKRAVLEQARASFVVRRGACAAEACKRAAYLDFMRNVSGIVESGQPKTQ